jgi:subtilase family serine protease
MMQGSITPRHFAYSAVTHLTLLSLLVTTHTFLVVRAYANSTTHDVFQPLIRFAGRPSVHTQSSTIQSNTTQNANHQKFDPFPIFRVQGSTAQNANNRKFACQSFNANNRCYGPSQIRKAYSIQPLLNVGTTGKGSTIVILDAFQAPNIQNDLAYFDKQFGLNGTKLNIIAPDGSTPFDAQDDDQVSWSGEISLDVEWTHVVAPDATIDLVLSKSDQDADMANALKYIADHNLGDVLSMSFGENEACVGSLQTWSQAFAKAISEGMTLLASSGDEGAAESTCDDSTYVKDISYPAGDSLVTGVGGTQLYADVSTGTYQNEVVWNEPDVQSASGGGFSTSIPTPSYQSSISKIRRYRGVPDVSYVAGVNDGSVLVNWSEGPRGPGFYTVGGTSVGSPQWAGIVALAKQSAKKRLGLLNQALYSIGQTSQYSSAFHDVTHGNNSITLEDANNIPVTIHGYSAAPGWDATTGWGSPQASALVPLLARY